MHDPIFYSFRRCPYAMRARLALAVSGQSCELREVALRARPQELYSASPKGTIPVLVGDKRVLDESLDIMLWTLGNRDPKLWLPANEQAREETERLIGACDGDFKHNLDRYKYSARHDPEKRDDYRESGAHFLRELNVTLAKSSYLLGHSRTLADQALAPFVRQFAFADKAWFDNQDWPHLEKWLDRFLGSPLFQRVMVKHPVWAPGDAPTIVTW
ncbi:MAG: glutathione S-transferase [Planctomycetota bacterium]|nr:glutathione S-transferase [Planctomycetota bacterium]